MPAVGTPSARAASTYGSWRALSVWARTTRAIVDQLVKARTAMSVRRPPRTMATIATASAITGNASWTSTSQLTTSSTQLR